ERRRAGGIRGHQLAHDLLLEKERVGLDAGGVAAIQPGAEQDSGAGRNVVIDSRLSNEDGPGWVRRQPRRQLAGFPPPGDVFAAGPEAVLRPVMVVAQFFFLLLLGRAGVQGSALGGVSCTRWLSLGGCGLTGRLGQRTIWASVFLRWSLNH